MSYELNDINNSYHAQHVTAINNLNIKLENYINQSNRRLNSMYATINKQRLEINNLKRIISSNEKIIRKITDRDMNKTGILGSNPTNSKIINPINPLNPLNPLNNMNKNILSILMRSTGPSNLGSSYNNNGITNNNSTDEYEIVEYTSDDEFEEVNIKINSIDDVISLGDYYEKLKIENPPEKQDDQNNQDIKLYKITNPTDKNDLYAEIQKAMNQDKKDETKQEKLIKHDYFEYNNKKYSIDLEKISKLKIPMLKLKSLIGLDSIKNSILEMIVYYMQHFESNNASLLHTIIEGPPGVGKTELGKIFAEIYAAMGIIPSSKFKLVKRTDLVGEYLGQTAHRTQEAINEANGGVLFIDEAYSLGNEEKKDSYAKECIDTLNQNLSENKNKIICIIAGYPEQLDSCFFNYNPGLKRRFPFKYTITGYNHTEMAEIFKKKINDIKFKLDNDINQQYLEELFKDNLDKFTNYGGDIDNLITNCKFMHASRVFGLHPKNKRILTSIDINKGFDRYLLHKKIKKENPSNYFMYA
jgi:SpoVK/Ycf46/Vps4 family AAA+-type ATPase